MPAVVVSRSVPNVPAPRRVRRLLLLLERPDGVSAVEQAMPWRADEIVPDHPTSDLRDGEWYACTRPEADDRTVYCRYHAGRCYPCSVAFVAACLATPYDPFTIRIDGDEPVSMPGWAAARDVAVRYDPSLVPIVDRAITRILAVFA